MNASVANPVIRPPLMPAHRERGLVLVTALLILLVISMVVLSSSQRTIEEQRITGNYSQHAAVFEAASSALREGEAKAATYATALSDFRTSGSGLWALGAVPNPFGVNFWSAAAGNSLAATPVVLSGGLAITPRYYIQLAAILSASDTTRATAAGAVLFHVVAYAHTHGGGSVVLSSYYQVALSSAPASLGATDTASHGAATSGDGNASAAGGEDGKGGEDGDHAGNTPLSGVAVSNGAYRTGRISWMQLTR